MHFERCRQNPLLTPTGGYEPTDRRDPYVFYNEAEQRWWMLIAARLDKGPRWRRGCIVLATSEDLLDWSLEARPLYVPGTTYCPECPEMWTAGGRWYLVFSRFSEDVGTIYRLADSPRGPFRAPAHDGLGGRRWYAARSTFDSLLESEISIHPEDGGSVALDGPPGVVLNPILVQTLAVALHELMTTV